MDTKGIILVVEDEQRIRRMISDYLTFSGYTIIEAGDGEEAEEIFYQRNTEIDLIILDVMMPKKDGVTLLKDIRKISNVPVIMLTAKGEEYDQLGYFKYGADDFISKPFSIDILLAHIEAIAKRCFQKGNEQVRAGDICVDVNQRKVIAEGKEIDLTPKEYEMLLYFIKNTGKVMKRDSILNEIWGLQYVGDIRTVDTHIKQLRSKLNNYGSYIKTVHGIGYRFEV